jgi:hypothetical protein
MPHAHTEAVDAGGGPLQQRTHTIDPAGRGLRLRESAVSGGLMNYGTSLTDAHRNMGVYAGLVLKGANLAGFSSMSR